MTHPLPELIEGVPREAQGLHEKFIVRRTDGKDAPGREHHGCEYFVLDIAHDRFAKAALLQYALECKATYPFLSADMITRYNLDGAFKNPVPDGYFKAEADGTLIWEEGCISETPDFTELDGEGGYANISKAFYTLPPNIEQIRKSNDNLIGLLCDAEHQLYLFAELLNATNSKVSVSLTRTIKRIRNTLNRNTGELVDLQEPL